MVLVLVPFNTHHANGNIFIKGSALKLKGLDTSGLWAKLFAEAAAEMPKDSIVCSPLAALLPLANLALGASLNTLQELLAAVGVNDRSQISLKFKPFIQSLPKLKGVGLKITNRIYVNKIYKLKSKFKKESKDIFRATAEFVEFNAGAEAAKQLNRMIKVDSYDTFDEMINPTLLPNGVEFILLLNAVHFVGEWQIPFAVTNGNFYPGTGQDRVVMMCKTNTYNYMLSRTLTAQIVEVPYQESEVSLVIILPNIVNGLETVLKALKKDPHLINREMQKVMPRKVTLTLPKFKTQTELNLTTLYKKIGVQEIFTSGISDMVRGGSVNVTEAVQKIFLEVSETSIVAALPGCPTEPAAVEFRADHPFVYFVKVGREPLFAGVFRRRAE